MLISKFGAATKEEISKLNLELPDDLQLFLLNYNGGETPETSFSISTISSDIVAFYGLGDVKYSYSDVEVMRFDNHEYLPIAFDSFGNQIVCSLPDGNIGFYDHERGAEPTIIADSLKSFCNLAISKLIDEKHVKPVEQREKELIARGKAAVITDELRDLWAAEIKKYASLHQEPVEL